MISIIFTVESASNIYEIYQPEEDFYLLLRVTVPIKILLAYYWILHLALAFLANPVGDTHENKPQAQKRRCSGPPARLRNGV